MENDFKEKDLQSLIGNLLRWGVFISMAIVIIGLFMFLIHNDVNVNDFKSFDSSKIFSFNDFFTGLKTFQSGSIITLGVVCLILTPILRVIFAIIGFAMEKDKLYVLISSIVLLIIFSSLFLGAVE